MVTKLSGATLHDPRRSRRDRPASIADADPFADEAAHSDRALLVEELQRTRTALARSEARYQALSERAPVMMHSIGRNGRIVSVSDFWLSTLGYRREEVIGRRSIDFLTEASRRYAVEVVLPDFMRTGHCADVPYEFVTRDGDIVDVLLSATAERNQAGEIVRSVAVLTNVTERKRAEAQLRLSEARLRALADNTPLVIFMKDLAGRYVVVNREFERANRWAEADVIGKTIYDMVPADEAALHAEHDRKAIESGKAVPYEFTTEESGRPQTWSGFKFPIVKSNGTTIGVGCVARNVTREREAERALRGAKEQAEAASRTKSEFLANMSHELRTPLNAIIGFSELMRAETFGPLSERYRGYAQDIFSSGSLLLDLINDVLDLSKIEARRYELREETAEIADLVAGALRLTRDAAVAGGIAIEERVPDDLPKLSVDPRLMTQVLLNLLSNAIKFTPAGGRVTITAALVDSGELEVQVADSGVGIAKRDLAKAMETFGQVESSLSRKHGGTGLGLPLAKGLTELHGGRLEIASQVGKGTTVTVRLPASRLIER